MASTFASTAPGRRPTEATAQRRLRQVRTAMQDPGVAPALAAAATHLDAVVPTMPVVELLLDGL